MLVTYLILAILPDTKVRASRRKKGMSGIKHKPDADGMSRSESGTGILIFIHLRLITIKLLSIT